MATARLTNSRVSACIALIVLSSTGCSISSQTRRSELGCDKYRDARSVEICGTIASELEWKMFGHAVPSPGYKVTTQTLVDTFCKLKLTQADVGALKPLTNGEARLRSAADSLLAMLGANPTVGDTSIVNPSHPKFLLTDGCPLED